LFQTLLSVSGHFPFPGNTSGVCAELFFRTLPPPFPLPIPPVLGALPNARITPFCQLLSVNASCEPLRRMEFPSRISLLFFSPFVVVEILERLSPCAANSFFLRCRRTLFSDRVILPGVFRDLWAERIVPPLKS